MASITLQMAKRGVSVKLGLEATPDLIREARPDAVILATGVTPVVPEIPGINKLHVVAAKDILDGAKVRDKIAIIGGGLVGCETAEFLVEQGKKVTILEMLDEVATGMPLAVRLLLLSRLADKGVTILTSAKCQEVTDSGLVIVTKKGEKLTIEADNVVLASGDKPNTALLAALRGTIPQIYPIGDCGEPQGILEAVADGYRVGLGI